MYTVMIAEDELLVRMGIASSVPWMQMGMRLVAEATDGEAALNAFYKYQPDIVITDIRMPKIDGIELIRLIREADKDCAIVVITNVEHKDTMDEVSRLGVSDFLLKATMKRDDIAATMLRVRENLPEKSDPQAMPEDNGKLWREFLLGNASGKAFCEQFAKANLACFAPHGFVLLAIRPSENMSLRLETSLVNLFKHRLSEKESFEIVELEHGIVAALAREKYDTDWVERALTTLARYVQDNFGETLCFAVQHHPSDPEEVRSSLRQAIGYIQQPAFFDQSVLRLNRRCLPEFPEISEAAKALRKCIPLSIKGATLARSADYLEDLPGALSMSWRNGMKSAIEILEMLGISHDAEFAGVHAMVHEIVNATQQTVESIWAGVRPEICAAIDYIENHITEALSIRQVAESVGYHPAYFSSLFKRELGMSYSDFLTSIRIQRAKEMLNHGGLTLQEIAESCGFSDLSYFSTKFKRTVGITPSQWRAKS